MSAELRRKPALAIEELIPAENEHLEVGGRWKRQGNLIGKLQNSTVRAIQLHESQQRNNHFRDRRLYHRCANRI